MNIKQAKTEVRNAIKAYLSKDEYSRYEIPVEEQRPLFLMGPPGIGKTAIMEQVASEAGIGLLSYSMTHHTRQSALGLPFISHKIYDGREYDISEYTMSEIIASVYEMMEETGIKEGILFLDEINCVSETLAPLMLQFLQYKVFGRHRVPDGWVVVTAGNPPEYNNSVREFDLVTWDRLKRIDVEADYQVWREYAHNTGIHPAISSYLDIKKDNFFIVESTVGGKEFVTARGWSDLSAMMRLYEKQEVTVNESLVVQYLQKPQVARDFAVYYDLFKKYQSDYQVEKILDGSVGTEIVARVRKAKFDERIALLSLILDLVFQKLKTVISKEQVALKIRDDLKGILGINPDLQKAALKNIAREYSKQAKSAETSKSLSLDDRNTIFRAQQFIEGIERKLDNKASRSALEIIKSEYQKLLDQLVLDVKLAKEQLGNVFKFSDLAFGEGQEVLILVTELTLHQFSARFISRYGCEEYFQHNKELMFYKRQTELITEILNLNLDDL